MSSDQKFSTLTADGNFKTITGGSTVGDVPAWVQTEVDKLNS